MLFLICCPVLLAGVALTVDVGAIYITRQALQNGVDAAAKAGGLELPNQKKAIAECTECARENNLDTSAERLTMRILDASGREVPGDDNENARRLEVKAFRDVPMTFARIFGIEEWPVGARALVAMDQEPVNVVVRDTAPFGIDRDLYQAQNTAAIAAVPCRPKGEEQQLWIMPGNLWPSDVEKMLIEGNAVTLAVGDKVVGSPDTVFYMDAIYRAILELARQADASEEYSDPENRNPNNPRILTVPLVQTVGPPTNNGHAQLLEVVGFASFYVDSVQGWDIKGHFVDTGSTDGQVDETRDASQGNQKGTIRAVRLIE